MSASGEPANEVAPSSRRIQVGVSACLLGKRVRYDGGHKWNRIVADCLARWFELVPVCPEVAIGLGTPRKPIRLAGAPESPRAIGIQNESLDVTERLTEYARRMAGELGDISGYLFKGKSPSCGMERVRVYGRGGAPRRIGRGLYAAEIMRSHPLLPVADEDRLHDPVRRENFIERLYAYRHWQDLLEKGVSAEALVEFHIRHKLIVMAHGACHARALEHLVAQAATRPIESLAADYAASFMNALSFRATRSRHTAVLFHTVGYLNGHLDSQAKAELVDLIHAYRQGLVPRSVPVTLLRRHFQRHPEPFIDKQLYLTWQPLWISFGSHR
ncbi:MAG: DUF523 and DUF1722 domain-containing protein [Nitrococcus sp.]|nr:DUF523 and DUF1722 domain-containing protein [Nitrococcus sp.]